MTRRLRPRPLSAAAFAPYGEVLDCRAVAPLSINGGLTDRFHALAHCRVAGEDEQVIVNIFRSRPVALPHAVRVLEQHPHGSQAFYPLDGARFLVLVAPAGETVCADALELFVSDGQQGVNYAPGVWHHYHLVLARESDFLVVDRSNPAANLRETSLRGEALIEVAG